MEQDKPKKQKTGGRVAGTPNKVTTQVREAILHAFDELGGVQWLVKWADKEPKAFMSLLGRVLPTQIKVDVPPDTEIKWSFETVSKPKPIEGEKVDDISATH